MASLAKQNISAKRSARFQAGNRRLQLCWGLVMKKSLKLFLRVAAVTIILVVSSEPMFARGGGAANITNSPGYQRRLQESRQQVSQPDAQPSATHRRKWQHRRRH
jgi:hypothetical protein